MLVAIIAEAQCSKTSHGMSSRFFDDVAKDSQMTQSQVKKVIVSMAKMTAKTLKSGENFKIPGYATVKLHQKAALPERERKVFGKQVTLPPRVASSCVRIHPVKKLKDAVNV